MVLRGFAVKKVKREGKNGKWENTAKWGEMEEKERKIKIKKCAFCLDQNLVI